jgi:hypothetical protein
MDVQVRYTVERDMLETIQVPDNASHEEITGLVFETISYWIASGRYGMGGGAQITRAHWDAGDGKFGGKG